MKRCRKCGETKPLNAFYKRTASPDGHTPRCKECIDKQQATEREQHPERVKARKRASYRKNHPEVRRTGRDPEKANKCATKYRQVHPDRVAASQEQWQAANPGVAAQRAADWYAENTEQARAWARVNAERLKSTKAAWRAENPERIKLYCAMRRALKKSATTVPFTAEQLKAKFTYWNDCCWVCGDPATALDHVKPLAAGGAHMLCNFRPICQRCNSRKRDKWPLPSRAQILDFCD